MSTPQSVSALADKMINRRVKGGNRADESIAMLAELRDSLSGCNLAMALHYQGFATERQADAFTEAIAREAVDRAYSRLSAAQDAEREALIWCMAAKGALPEVKTAREAHLMTVRVELAQARLEWQAVTA